MRKAGGLFRAAGTRRYSEALRDEEAVRQTMGTRSPFSSKTAAPAACPWGSVGTGNTGKSPAAVAPRPREKAPNCGAATLEQDPKLRHAGLPDFRWQASP